MYVLSLISVNHALNHVPEQSNIGVYSSKEAACAAAGSLDTGGYGTFDYVIENRLQESVEDNRDNPPNNGCLLQIGDAEEGEGDYVQLKIEQFTIQGGGAVNTQSENKKPSNAIASTNSIEAGKSENTRHIYETALMELMKEKMEANEHAELNRKIQTLARQLESEAAPLRHTKDHIFGANV